MIEVVAALTGSAFTALVMGVNGGMRSSSQHRDMVTRLTVAVENVAQRLEELHQDIKADRKETFSRLHSVEHRVTVLETQNQS